MVGVRYPLINFPIPIANMKNTEEQCDNPRLRHAIEWCRERKIRKEIQEEMKKLRYELDRLSAQELDKISESGIAK